MAGIMVSPGSVSMYEVVFTRPDRVGFRGPSAVSTPLHTRNTIGHIRARITLYPLSRGALLYIQPKNSSITKYARLTPRME